MSHCPFTNLSTWLEAGRLTERRNSVLRMWAGQEAVNLIAENTTLRLELLTARMVAAEAVERLEQEARTVRRKRLAAELRKRIGKEPEQESAESPQDVRKRPESGND
jgi:regulator of replication initiation timing